jgi:hypothetical protein
VLAINRKETPLPDVRRSRPHTRDRNLAGTIAAVRVELARHRRRTAPPPTKGVVMSITSQSDRSAVTDDPRHLLTLSAEQTAELAYLCRGAAEHSGLLVHGAAGTLELELRTAIGAGRRHTTPRGHERGRPVCLSGAQAQRIAQVCGRGMPLPQTLHLYAPHPQSHPPGTLQLEVVLDGGASAWLLDAGGRIAAPIAAPGDIITLHRDPPEFQAATALDELYRFVPSIASRFRRRLDESRHETAALDEIDRAELLCSLTREMLRTLDARHPLRPLTCRSDLVAPDGSPGVGWGIAETPPLRLVTRPAA